MQQKLKYSFVALVVLQLFGCGKTCKTYTQYETAPVILEYFGNYKPGNYWIYENQDGTKKDSMWVSDYEEGKGGNVNSCCQYPKIQFVLNSHYWGKNNKLKTIIENGPCKYSKIILRDTQDMVIYNISDRRLKDTPASELDKQLLSNVGIKSFYSKRTIDTFTLIKYYIK